MSDLVELLDHYFSLGVSEGKEGRDHDTPTGEAQATRDLIDIKIGKAATEIEALRRENQELRAERDSARNDEWLAAISAVQFMVANWQQDCRTPESLKALIDAGEDIVSSLKQAGPTEYLDMKWKGAQEALAAEEVARELRADCQRKDELLTAAVDDYNDALEANRKLHRRAQLAERTHQMAIDVLTGWYDYLCKHALGAPKKGRFLFRSVIGDMKARAERFDRALTMSDIHREQLDRPADKETP